MCGTPYRSRTTRTGAERPATSRRPDTSATSGAGCPLPRHATAGASARQAHATHHRAPPRFTLRRMAIKDALLADYDHEMGTTRRLLERVPDDKLAWRPHDKSRSMGDLATHVSRIPSWGAII